LNNTLMRFKSRTDKRKGRMTGIVGKQKFNINGGNAKFIYTIHIQ